MTTSRTDIDGGQPLVGRKFTEGDEVCYSGNDVPIEVVDCHFDGCKFILAGAAARTMQFFSALYQAPGGAIVVENFFNSIRSEGGVDRLNALNDTYVN